MTQNSMRLDWTREEVDERLHNIMISIHESCRQTATTYGEPDNYVMGASLSAYDVVNQLFAPSTGCRFERAGENRLEFVPCGNERRVWLCSRSGRMKKIQSRYPNPPSFAHLAGALQQDRPRGEMTLDELFGLFLLDAADAGVEIDRAAMADPYAGCSSAPAVNARAAGILAQDIDAAAAGPGSVENFIVDYLDASQMTI